MTTEQAATINGPGFTLDISEHECCVDVSVHVAPDKADELIRRFWKKNGKSLNKVLKNGKKKGPATRNKVEEKMGGREVMYQQLFCGYGNEIFISQAPRKVMLTNSHQAYMGEDGWWLVRIKGWMEPPVYCPDNIMEGLDFLVPCIDVEAFVAERLQSFTTLHPYLHNKVDAQGEAIPASPGDMVEINVECTVDDQRFEAGCEKSTSIRLIQDTIRPPELYNGLLGKVAGGILLLENVKNIPSKYRDELADKVMRLNVKVLHVYTCEEAKIDDDMAITAGFENLEQWRHHLRDTNTRRLNTYKEQMRRQLILDYVMKHIDVQDLSKEWQEAKVKELIDAGKFNQVTPPDRLCEQINSVAKHSIALKIVGEKLGVEWVDKDKDRSERDEGAYAAKVLDHLIKKAKFTDVDAETKKNG